MSSTNKKSVAISSRITRRQLQKQQDIENKNKRKLETENNFKSKKRTGPADILVNTQLGKIKVDEPGQVKQEAANGEICEQVAPTYPVPLSEENEVDVKFVTDEVDIDEDKGPSELGGATDGKNVASGYEGGETIVKTEPEEVNNLVDESEMVLPASENKNLPKVKSKKELEDEIRALREIVADQALEIHNIRKKLKAAETALATERGLKSFKASFRQASDKVHDDGNMGRANIPNSDLHTPVDNYFDSEFRKVATFLLDFLDLNHVLKCRLVSHKWKNGIDSALETHLLQFATGKTTTTKVLGTENLNNDDEREKECKTRFVSHQPHVLHMAVQQLQAKYTFFVKQDLVKFQKYAVNCEGNPFVGRCATFVVTKDTLETSTGKREYLDSLLSLKENIANCENVESELYECAYNLWQEIGRFVSTYGKHLWHLTLMQDKCGLTPARLGDVLQILLPYLENLKTLSFSVSFINLEAEHPHNCRSTGFPRKSTGELPTLPPTCVCIEASLNGLLRYRANQLLYKHTYGYRYIGAEIFTSLLQLETVKIRVRDTCFKHSKGAKLMTKNVKYEDEYCERLSYEELWNSVCPNLKCIVLDFSILEEKINPAEVESLSYQKTCVITCDRSKKEIIFGKVKSVVL